MTEFHQTRIGRQFYSVTLPTLTEEVARLAHALEAWMPVMVDVLARLPESTAAGDVLEAVWSRRFDLRVLLVEDDATVRRAYAQMLQATGTVVAVRSVAEAKEALAGSGFDGVVTDFDLPGGETGVELLEYVRRRHPAMRRVLVSGHPRDALQAHEASGLAGVLLTKPVTGAMLREAVRPPPKA